ncbi:MAG: hypothetical protein WC467_02165 [Patescibacteria group bacterium]
MNNNHLQKSTTKMTPYNNGGAFAFIGLVDRSVGISTFCLLFIINQFITPNFLLIPRP